jgi:hypothetical protein
MQRCFNIIGILIIFLFFTGCSKEKSLSNDNASLELNIKNQMGGNPLQLDFNYFNAFNEDLKISRLKYYISNIHLINGNEGKLIPDSYFLIDEQNNASRKIKMSIPSGQYTAVAFLLGVDSTRNVSGAQTGALDPALDMFWTWSTGYIMAKLEGTSSFSTAPNNRIQYHIGGFSGVNNVLRMVVIDLPPDATLKIGNTLKIDLQAEIQNWFQSVHDMRIANNAVIMGPGSAAMQFADNYNTMFTATSIEVK